jgi:hypothetical protein
MFAELRQAAELTQCGFDDKYLPVYVIDAMETRYRLLSALRMVRQLADYRVCQGRPADAVACLEQIRRYEEHMKADPRACEPTFYYWLESSIRQGVEHISAHSEGLPAEDMRRLITARALPTEEIYRDGIKWHAAAIQQHLFNCYSGAEYERPEFQFEQAFGDREKRQLPRWLWLAGMRLTSARDDLDAVRALFPFTADPHGDAAWKPHWDDVSPQGTLVSSAQSISYMPYWADRGEANRRLTNIGVAAALYRQDEGEWPESLDVLAPKYLDEILPPSDGEKPFRVKVIEGGMMVYSAELDDEFEKFEDEQAWWERASDFVQMGYSMFLGQARERLIEFEPGM